MPLAMPCNHNVTLPLFLHLENMRLAPENHEPDLVKSILQRPFHVTLTNREEERLFLELRGIRRALFLH